MALSINKNVPPILAMLALMISFVPELSEGQRSIGATGLWIVAMIAGTVLSPPDLAERPPKIIWDERDGGEKFSIIMLHLLLLLVAFLIAYQIVLGAYSAGGSTWMLLLSALVATSSLWAIWHIWENRNAR